MAVGKAEETVDVQYNAEKERFDQSHKALRDLRDSVVAYERALKQLSAAHTKVSERVQACYDAGCSLWPAVLAQQMACNDAEQARGAAEAHWQARFHEPFAAYLMQHRSLLQRAGERDRRRTDMDRYRREVRGLRESSSASAAAKLPAAGEKAEAMTRAYEELNQELLRDMPRLVDDCHNFFDPLFAVLVEGQLDYFARMTPALQQLSHMVSSPAPSPHQHPSVITPPEHSAFSRPAHNFAHSHSQPPPQQQDVLVDPYTHIKADEITQGYSIAPPHDAFPSAQVSTDPSLCPPPPSLVVFPPPDAPPSLVAFPHVDDPQVSSARLATALYDFVAEEPNQLGFAVGDVVTIHAYEGEWWIGELHGRRGLLPASYVRFCQ